VVEELRYGNKIASGANLRAVTRPSVICEWDASG
jgi:hypothetical protein